MSGPSPLAKWRESLEFTAAAAARWLGISRLLYLRLEAGEGEISPSLAMEISRRTNFAVMPGDLPGCGARLSDAVRIAPPAPASDGAEASGKASAPQPFEREPIIGEPGGLTLGANLSRQSGDWAVWLHLSNPETCSGSAWAMTGAAAQALGVELIRLAALAASPGGVPS